jgi:hypothetical protein
MMIKNLEKISNNKYWHHYHFDYDKCKCKMSLVDTNPNIIYFKIDTHNFGIHIKDKQINWEYPSNILHSYPGLKNVIWRIYKLHYSAFA